MKRLDLSCPWAGHLVLLAAMVAGAAAVAQPLPDRWSLDDAQTLTTPTRSEVCLNALWDISLNDGVDVFVVPELSKKQQMRLRLEGKSVEPQPQPAWTKAERWQPMRVPGLWYDTHWRSTTQYESLIATLSGEQDRPHERASDRYQWEGRPLRDLAFAWYQRKIQVPADWEPGSTFIRVGRVYNEAWVFINDQLIGHQSGEPHREYALPEGLDASQPITLSILVGAHVEGERRVFMGGDQIHTVKATSQTRGIGGDVWLVHQPKAHRVDQLTIATSTRQKRIEVSFHADHPGVGRAKVVVKTYPTGETALAFESPLKKNVDGRYTLGQAWDDPDLWTPDTPALYVLQLELLDADGNLIDAPLPQRFGFREIWIDGRDYRLNGHPVHFRIQSFPDGPDELVRSELLRLKQMGYNTVSTGSGISFDVLDEVGMMALANLPGVNNMIFSWDGDKDGWQRLVSTIIHDTTNHPSIMQWTMNINLLGYPFDLNPHTLATDYLPGEDTRVAMRWKVASQSEAFVEATDPTRPAIQYAGGNFGTAHTSNMYLCFSPLQEKRQWPSIWAETGKKPFIAIELGTPYVASYFRNREGVGKQNNHKSEPLYDEYAARVLGPVAYEQSERMEPILASAIEPNGLSDGSDFYRDMLGIFYSSFRREALPNFVKTQVALGDFYWQWRTLGVSGFNPWNTEHEFYSKTHIARHAKAHHASLKTPGKKPYFVYQRYTDEPTELVPAYTRWMQPIVRYIAGPSSDFIDATHSYMAGSDIHKSIVVINDSFKPIDEDYEITLVDEAEQAVATQRLSVAASPGQTVKSDFSFTSPQTPGRYRLVLTQGEGVTDTFAIQVAAPQEKVELRKDVFLIDEHGMSLELLSRFGLNPQRYTGQPLDSDDLLIVGRESAAAMLPHVEAIRDAVKTGLNVMVFEQQAADLEDVFGLRGVEASARQVFASPRMPFTPPFGQDDWHDWAGKATLLPEYPVPTREGYPKHIYKHGNAQTVASVVIEKPHAGAFRSHLHEGFDLAYSPLLEERIGAGRIIYCQLDVTGRDTANPPGDALVASLLHDLDRPETGVPQSLVYIGGETGRHTLSMTGLAFSDEMADIDSQSVVVVGDGAAGDPRLREFLGDGGTVVLLAQRDLGGAAEALGLDVSPKPMSGYTLPMQDVPGLTDGLGGGDWYWKDNYAIDFAQPDQPIASFESGNGRVVLCQVEPLHFTNELHQRRQRTQAKLVRILSTVLTNLGGRAVESSLDIAAAGGGLKPIDLAGEWDFKIDPESTGSEQGWQREQLTQTIKLNVPSIWETQSVTQANPSVPGKQPYDGVAWYQKPFIIPSAYRDQDLVFEAGSIDDYDQTYFNGELIGTTGSETPEHWKALRRYAIPSSLIRWDGENVLTIRVDDTAGGGGITGGPVQVAPPLSGYAPYLDRHVRPNDRFDPYLFHRW